MKRQEIIQWSPVAGLNVAQYAPNQKYTQLITHANGLVSRVDNYSTGKGQMNLNLSASGVHFIPTERRYKEDIEKAIDGLDILIENLQKKDEPKHFDIRNPGMGLEFMEHTTFVDNPTLDAIDHVRSIMTNRKTKILGQRVYQEIERIMTRKPMIYGTPSNAQAKPDRFIKEKKDTPRDPITGEKFYEAEIGTY